MTERVYLPTIHNNAPVTGTAPRMSPNAQAFAAGWMQALGARAAVMVLDDRLTAAAMLHAEFLSQRTGDELLQSMHVGDGGTYPNGRVIAVGYKLPSGPNGYSPFKNNVESCARNAGGPLVALEGLLASPSHHDHMMGVEGFSDRVVWGVGAAGDDYVVLACPPEEAT